MEFLVRIAREDEVMMGKVFVTLLETEVKYDATEQAGS